MPVVGVVAVFPVGDGDLCVEKGDPLVHVQAFVADPVVERLDESVTPGLTGRDGADPDPVFAEFSERFGDKFGPVIATDQHRHAPNRHDGLEHCDEILAGDRSCCDVEQRFSGVLIDHRRDLELSAIGGRVVLEIDSPHSLLPLRMHRRGAGVSVSLSSVVTFEGRRSIISKGKEKIVDEIKIRRIRVLVDVNPTFQL